ncbi:36909_t:CDS:1, partial [Gigaspora margarita]
FNCSFRSSYDLTTKMSFWSGVWEVTKFVSKVARGAAVGVAAIATD